MTKQKSRVSNARKKSPIVFRRDNDLIGMRHGVYEEELGGRFVYVSPAIYSLMQSDRASVVPGLMVSVDGEIVPLMDLDI